MYIVFKEAYISIHIYICREAENKRHFGEGSRLQKRLTLQKNEETQGLHYFPNKRKTNKKEEKLFLLKSCNKLFVKKREIKRINYIHVTYIHASTYIHVTEISLYTRMKILAKRIKQ